MLLKRILLKIETGQVLTEKQQKALASKLYLVTPFKRTLLYTIIGIFLMFFLIVGFVGGFPPIESWFAFLMVVVLGLFLLYYAFVPGYLNIKKYFVAIDKFYQNKFKQYEHFDLAYIGQHVNPHIKPLRSPKIYLLTDGYHFLFVNDYFKDTSYLLPNYIAKGHKVYLRVLNDKITDNYRMMVRLPDIEHYYLVEQKEAKEEKQRVVDTVYFNHFLDQDPKMKETYVVLKMRGGVIFRLSYEAYPIFLETMPLKELIN